MFFRNLPVLWALLFGLWGLLGMGAAHGQTALPDTVFLLMNDGHELPVQHVRDYATPKGTLVRQYKAKVQRTKVGHMTFLLHIPGSSDSVLTQVQGVSGLHPIWQDNGEGQVQDLVTIRHRPAQAVECGQTNLCQPDRLVLDVRLSMAPLAYLWVCHVYFADAAP